MPITVQHSPDAAAIVMPAYAAGAAQAAARNNAQALQWAQLGSSNVLKQQQLAQSAAAQNQDAALKQQQLGLSARGQLIDAQMKQQQLGQSGLRDMMQMGLAYGQAYDNSALRWAGLDRDFALQQMRQDQATKMQEASIELARERMTEAQRAKMAEFNRQEQMVNQMFPGNSPFDQRGRAAALYDLNGGRQAVIKQALEGDPFGKEEPTPNQIAMKRTGVYPMTFDDGTPNPLGGVPYILDDKNQPVPQYPPKQQADPQAVAAQKQQEAAAKEQQRQMEQMQRRAETLATDKETGDVDEEKAASLVEKFLKLREDAAAREALKDPSLPPLPPSGSGGLLGQGLRVSGKSGLSPSEELAARRQLQMQQQQQAVQQQQAGQFLPPGMQAGPQQAPQPAQQPMDPNHQPLAAQIQSRQGQEPPPATRQYLETVSKEMQPLLKEVQGKPQAQAVQMLAQVGTQIGDWSILPENEFQQLQQLFTAVGEDYVKKLPEGLRQRFFQALKNRREAF